jgi:hypothetical protein
VFLMVVKRPSKDKKQQACSLKGSRCTLGFQGASFLIEILDLSVHFDFIVE